MSDGQWLQATISRGLGSLASEYWDEDGLETDHHCVTSGKLFSLSEPQLICIKLLEQWKCHWL